MSRGFSTLMLAAIVALLMLAADLFIVIHCSLISIQTPRNLPIPNTNFYHLCVDEAATTNILCKEPPDATLE